MVIFVVGCGENCVIWEMIYYYYVNCCGFFVFNIVVVVVEFCLEGGLGGYVIIFD